MKMFKDIGVKIRIAYKSEKLGKQFSLKYLNNRVYESYVVY